MPIATQDFAGLDDWFEVFRAGPQTDSAGHTRTWTTDELDEMVRNHDADHPAPFVAGHPKTDDPAYGWTAGLKRVGERLLARGQQIQEAFHTAVKDGRFRNRSVRIVRGPNGFKIGHVGFLGAAPPAVEGLKPVQFEADVQITGTYEFAFADARPLGVLARLFRRIREAWIDQHGLEKADAALPEYALDDLAGMDTAARVEAATERQMPGSRDPAYTAAADMSAAAGVPPDDSHGEAAMPDKTFTQADLDAAVATERSQREAAEQRAKTLDHAARVAKHEATVRALVNDDARLTPAQATGLAAFMAQLDATEAEFSFSAGEGQADQKATPARFFADFLAKFPKQLALRQAVAGEDVQRPAAAAFSAGTPVDPDRAALDQRARDYMAQHPGTDYVAAVRICQQQGA